MTFKRLLLLALGLCLSPSVAVGQDSYGGELYFSRSQPHHASTAAEGAMRGMGDLVRSAGEANLRNSQAAINYEKARSDRFDNRLKYAEVYFQRRRLNQEYKEKTRRRITPEQAYRVNKGTAPARLSANDVDPLSGKINWPEGLKRESFGRDRDLIDRLFAQRAKNYGVMNRDDYMQLQEVAKQMQKQLARDYKLIPTPQRIEARKFLRSLVYESGMVSS